MRFMITILYISFTHELLLFISGVTSNIEGFVCIALIYDDSLE